MKLFGDKQVTVGKPPREQPGWDETIHAEVDDPDLRAPSTGGRILSRREWRDLNPYPNKPSSWTFADALPGYIIGALLIMTVLLIAGTLLMSLAGAF